MGFPAGPLAGAPVGLAGEAVARLADSDGALPVNGGIAAMTPTAARALTLPPLSTVGDGDHVTVRSLAAFALTINVGDPNDHMNDALAGSAAVPGNGNLTVVADKTTVPNTWLSLT